MRERKEKERETLSLALFLSFFFLSLSLSLAPSHFLPKFSTISDPGSQDRASSATLDQGLVVGSGGGGRHHPPLIFTPRWWVEVKVAAVSCHRIYS